MATSKEYAYYVKGNRIAVVQKDWTFSGGQTLSQPGLNDLGTMGALLWKSPVEDVTRGIELQYVYSPTYNLQSTGTEGTDFHRFIGWGSDGANLLLFTFGASAVANLSSLFAADDWILIKGSGRWSGLHQVKSTGGTTGILTLKTRCNIPAAKLSTTVNFTTSETITGQNADHKMDIEAYKDATSSRSERYIFIDLADKAVNSGLFSLSDNTTSGVLTSNKRIVIDADGDYTEENAAMEAESSTNDAIVIYNAFYEQLSVYEGVEVMQDESFEVDVTRYQGNALVYYLKARYAEDAGNIEGKEYFMREFRRMVEKHESNKVIGPRRMQGFSHFSNN